MELKFSIAKYKIVWSVRLQSHLYGIEILDLEYQIFDHLILQSHLYGIEIMVETIEMQLVSRTPIAPLWN